MLLLQAPHSKMPESSQVQSPLTSTLYITGILQYDVKATGDRWWAQVDTEKRNSYGRDSFYPRNKVKGEMSKG